TEEKISSVTFNENPLFTVTFNLVDGTFKTLNLDAPKNEKEVAIDDDEESSNSSTEIAIQESAQNSSFDVEADNEYSNSDEEIDEQNFNAALTLLHETKSNSTDRHQFNVKKVNKNERFNKRELLSSNAAKESQASGGRVSLTLTD
ncbi:30629_t:CDS:2, partial [Racocetra persica]